VPVIDHRDQYDRPVYRSGFGIGQAVPGGSLPPPPPASIVKSPPSAENTLKPDPVAAYARALKAAQPVRGREPKLGWTVSE
jgi:hypothetical protein